MKEIIAWASIGCGLWMTLFIGDVLGAMARYYKARARLLDAKAERAEKGYRP